MGLKTLLSGLLGHGDGRRAVDIQLAGAAEIRSLPAARRRPLSVRGFAAAGTGRLLQDFETDIREIDHCLRYGKLRTIRSRSRLLEMNEPFMGRWLMNLVTNVVGDAGLQLQSLVEDAPGRPDETAIDLIERGWYEWANPEHCDWTRRRSLRKLQALFMRQLARDGEVFIQIIRNADNPWRFALLPFDADLVDDSLNVAQLPDGGRIVMGIETGPDERRRAYWVSEKSALAGHTLKRRRLPAADVIHYFDDRFASQTRGIPWIHAAMLRLHMLGAWTEAEVVAARVASCSGGWLKSPSGDAYTGSGPAMDDDGEPQPVVRELEPGTWEQIPEGLEPVPVNPLHPTTTFTQFQKAMLIGIGAAVNQSYPAFSGDIEGVTYSSIRASLQDERRFYRQLQKDQAEHIWRPVFLDWLLMGLVAGKIGLPPAKYEKFQPHAWQGRGWDWIDPDADTKANATLVAAGHKSNREVIEERGGDLEATWRQLQRERRLAEKLGLDLTLPGKKTEPPGRAEKNG